MLGHEGRVYTHGQLDITDSAALERAIDEVTPEVVFNCAAFHNVDTCEREPARSWQVNVDAVREIARRSPRLVHISTNYVFDGRRETPYAELDLPCPRSVYALTKLAGEYAALAYCQAPLVVRTAGLYGLGGSASKGGNFVQRMIRRAREQGSLTVVADQRLQPTFTQDLAQAMLMAVKADATGIIHLTAAGGCSWYEFTCAIMARAGISVPIEPASTRTTEGGVDRPLNGVLARPRTDALGLPPLRPWNESLDDYLEQAGLDRASQPG
jgi:dTDP-4-dehydrorhamnose reductase